MQGRLIVFEGVEGSGKTTQIRRSQGWLTQNDQFQKLQSQGLLSHLVLTREPGGTPLGQQLRQILLHSAEQAPIHNRVELLLYAADRAQHVEEFLKPLLLQGAMILCDRFTDSTIAYQGYGRGLERSLIDQLNAIATQGLQSDLTLWLDVEVEVGLARTYQRGTADRIEQADLTFHKRVQQGFAELAKAYPHRIVRIDANPDEDQVADQIQAVLHRYLPQWYQ
jgi:dTMP kinase